MKKLLPVFMVAMFAISFAVAQSDAPPQFEETTVYVPQSGVGNIYPFFDNGVPKSLFVVPSANNAYGDDVAAIACAGTVLNAMIRPSAMPIKDTISKLDAEVTATDKATKHLVLFSDMQNANTLVLDLRSTGRLPKPATPTSAVISYVRNAFTTGKDALVIDAQVGSNAREACDLLTTDIAYGKYQINSDYWCIDFRYSPDPLVYACSPTSTEKIMAEGEELTLTYPNSPDKFVAKLAGVSDADTVVVTINGASQSVDRGNTILLNGLSVYVKDVYFFSKEGQVSSAELVFDKSSVITPPPPTNERVLSEGEQIVFTLDSVSYAVKLDGVSDADTVVVTVDGYTQSIDKGQTKAFGGLDVFVKDVYFFSKPGQVSSAQLVFTKAQQSVRFSATADRQKYLQGQTVKISASGNVDAKTLASLGIVAVINRPDGSREKIVLGSGSVSKWHDGTDYYTYIASYSSTDIPGRYEVWIQGGDSTIYAKTSFEVLDRKLLEKYLILSDIGEFKFQSADVQKTSYYGFELTAYYAQYLSNSNVAGAGYVFETASKDEARKFIDMVKSSASGYAVSEQIVNGNKVLLFESQYGAENLYLWSNRNLVVAAAEQRSVETYVQKRCTGFQYFVYQDHQLSDSKFTIQLLNGNQAVNVKSIAVSGESTATGDLGLIRATDSSGSPIGTLSPSVRYTLSGEKDPTTKANGDIYSYTVTIEYDVIGGISGQKDLATCTGKVVASSQERKINIDNYDTSANTLTIRNAGSATIYADEVQLYLNGQRIGSNCSPYTVVPGQFLTCDLGDLVCTGTLKAVVSGSSSEMTCPTASSSGSANAATGQVTADEAYLAVEAASGDAQLDESELCPAVCVPMWEKVSGACKYTSCGSGCGPDGVATFGTEAACKSSITTEEQLCKASGGTWKQFSNGCADSCALARNPGSACITVITAGCDCGKDACWNGGACESNALSCPSVAVPACEDGSTLRKKTDANGCIAGYECVPHPDTNAVLYAYLSKHPSDYGVPVDDKPVDREALLSIVLDLETLKINLDGLQDNAERLAAYYSSIGDTANAEKFDTVVDMLETAKGKIDIILQYIRDNIDNPDVEQIRSQVKALRAYMNDILIVLLGGVSDVEINFEITAS